MDEAKCRLIPTIIPSPWMVRITRKSTETISSAPWSETRRIENETMPTSARD